MRNEVIQKHFFKKNTKTLIYALILIQIMAISVRTTLYTEDGYVDLAFYSLSPIDKISFCAPFFDENHF